ncbi:GntR family transcriptional regulator [Peribacillus saganii]|nr:GntR family transcriptional regulator [Peribacillus saganii]
MEEMGIVDALIIDMNAGKYGADDKLPSENEMADRFKVPRIKIRKVYERLQELGYIYSQQGKGSFVKDRKCQIPLVLSGDVSFSKKMAEQGYQFESKNIFCEEINHNPKIYQSLGVTEAERVFKVGRLRLVDQRPIALHISYVAKSIFNDIDIDGKKITSMFGYYNRKGYRDFSSKSSVLSVVFPSAVERDILECSSLVPLLALESGCIDIKTDTVLEHTKILYRSDSFTYVI